MVSCGNLARLIRAGLAVGLTHTHPSPPPWCPQSTLLRFIMGTEAPQAGEVALGAHNVIPNYFEQNQAEALDLELGVIETLERAAVGWKECDIKVGEEEKRRADGALESVSNTLACRALAVR